MRRFLLPMSLLVSLFAGGPVAAQTPVTPATELPSRTLTVSAGADVPAVPDRADVTLGVQTRASTAQAAMLQNNDAMAKVVAALKALGIPDANLQTSSINLSPVYNN